MDERLKIPKHGWKAALDRDFPEPRSPQNLYTVKQCLFFVACAFRYLIYYIKLWFTGWIPVMDFVKLEQSQRKSGVPIGGLGGGSIGRGFKGEFYEYQMIPGMYETTTVSANQFILTIKNENKSTVYQKLLSCMKKPCWRLSSWDWSFPPADAEYTALFPRAWTVYDIKEHEIKVVCQQISPVIPHNYKDSCVPGAVFEWKVYNYGLATKYVSITFTFKNGTGGSSDKSGNVTHSVFDVSNETTSCCGVCIDQNFKDLPCTYSVSVLKSETTSVSRCCYFDPTGNGRKIWDSLKRDGELEASEDIIRWKNQETACAVCGKATVNANDEASIVFSVTWDMPRIRFRHSEVWHTRYYTKFFGSDGFAGPKMCLYSLSHYKHWIAAIEKWQNFVLQNDDYPDWYKSALFNESYYIADGGTVWLLPTEEELKTLSSSDPRREYGRFGYLEGHEYRMYVSYDVHFYASFALLMLWPKLQLAIQYEFKDTIDKEDKSTVWYYFSGARAPRKVKYTIPHDLGDPDEDPFIRINAYPVHDVSFWRDLNLKFVLQVYRDYVATDDFDYLRHMFPSAHAVIKYSHQFDYDNDGVIENSGTPDQTYDAWVMTGVSAYCGGLWLAALASFIKMAKVLEDRNLLSGFVEEYSQILSKGIKNFDKKLWNGSYYLFDESNSSQSTSIMADQLCGYWYLVCSDVQDEIFYGDHVLTALETIYKNNVCKYYGGDQGAVNGMYPDGQIDRGSTQSEEVWTGVTYSVAALLVSHGMVQQGFNTARGIYETVYEKSGLGFQTPEALHSLGSFRSLAYMRPLSIWSVQMMLNKRENAKTD